MRRRLNKNTVVSALPDINLRIITGLFFNEEINCYISGFIKVCFKGFIYGAYKGYIGECFTVGFLRNAKAISGYLKQ